MPGSSADPDSGGYGPETRHMFCQDGDPVRESGSFDVVYHSIRTQNGVISTPWCKGGQDPSTP